MRRIVTALVAGPVVLLAAIPANADRPIEVTQENLFMGCMAQTDIGRVEANIDAGVDWSYGGVVVFEDDFGEPYLVPDIQGEPPEPAPVIGDGVAEIDVGLLEQMTGDPAGQAAASFTFEPVGDPYPIDEKFRDGNRKITQTGSWTDLAVAGSYEIILTDGTVVAGEFDECGGGLSSLSYRETNPHAYVARYDSADIYCTVPYGDGFVEVGASQWDDDANAYLAIFEYGDYMNPPTATGDTPIGGLAPGPLAVTFDLFDGLTGEPLGETATLDATIVEGDTIPIDIVSQYSRETGSQTEWTATGTLSLPDGTTLDLDGYCYGGTWEVKTFAVQPNGPKPTGKAPRNDTPDGASLLSRADNAQTKAAAFDPEASCQISFEDEAFDVPLVKTVWYEMTGTGETVTVTTAGSRFDTVLGVYDDQLTQLGCVDDVADGAAYSLQAAIEFPTQEGDTYYIQAGGFGDQYGLLKIHTK
jgi:hypothetical protein